MPSTTAEVRVSSVEAGGVREEIAITIPIGVQSLFVAGSVRIQTPGIVPVQESDSK